MIQRVIELIGLASLIAFTAITTALAVVFEGALIYYYEPNKVVWGIEIALGTLGVVVGCKEIWRWLMRFESERKMEVKVDADLDRCI